MGAMVRANGDGLFPRVLSAVSVGGSPTGAGESPAPPIPETPLRSRVRLRVRKSLISTRHPPVEDAVAAKNPNARRQRDVRAVGQSAGPLAAPHRYQRNA